LFYFFLLFFSQGLQVFGTNWALVQYAVRTRPKTQVAAHGQSYVARQVVTKRLKRSIHDITLSDMLRVEEEMGLDLKFNWLESGSAANKRNKAEEEQQSEM
jgi:hypothetical protein